ncbi:hypothetical protein DPMN_177346 [Dreissena polymorpha]|uniref:Sugar phosphate transporter domain-containing protein n=1 Tax=Dreissena polymorpha TaxID=45954 RepID=A0A9D4EA25_DREPO|nr:hypothetical protein DPMN_177346 [Dreissena polymorpha]
MTAAEKKIRELEATAHVQLVKLKTSMKPKAENLKKSLTSVSFLTLAVKTLALVLFYYAFSIGLTFYNQRFIKHWNYPLSLTMAHLVVKFMISALMRNLIECKTGKPRVILPWGVYCKRVAPAGITSALDIGLSNWSFEFITVSLYTMSKSTAVIFILFFALIMRLEKWRWSLVVVVLFIATGLFMFTYHSTQFNAEGFAMVMTASLLSGLRWTLAQVVMQKNELGLHNPLDTMYHIQCVYFFISGLRNPLDTMYHIQCFYFIISGLHNPLDTMYHIQCVYFFISGLRNPLDTMYHIQCFYFIISGLHNPLDTMYHIQCFYFIISGLHNPLDTMYHIQPWMIVGLIPLSAGFEGIPLSTTDQFFRFSEYGVLLRNCGLVLLGALLAFMLEFSEYLLLSQTSSLTLSISGIFKEVCTLYIAHKVNGDTMNMVNGIGLIVCLVGITLHVVIKAVNNREKSLSSPLREDSIQMLKMDNTANISDDEDEEIYSVKGRLLTN